MCSIATNASFDDGINDKHFPAKDRQAIEQRLQQYASEANIKSSSGLDNPSGRLKHMPNDLRHVMHIRVGYHRVYYVGHHTKCHYFAFLLKSFKKSDVDNEGSKGFQNKMRSALKEEDARLLCLPDREEESTQENSLT